MNDLSLNELIRSRDEKRILTGKISGIEDEFYKVRNELVACAIIWYGDIKVLIPSEHMGTTNINKSVLRGMIQAEVDFIVVEIDETANIAIASRKLAMELRSELELPKLNANDNVRVRILSVGTKHIVVELYGKEVVIKAEHLKHTFIFNCKNYFRQDFFISKTMYVQNLLMIVFYFISANFNLSIAKPDCFYYFFH